MNEIKFKFCSEDISVKSVRSSYILPYPCSSHKTCSPYESTLPPGRFLLEVWGSQGGSDGPFSGGKGGYSRGILSLRSPTKAFFYVGAVGNCNPLSDAFSDSSFNGGGIGKNNGNNIGSSGGGGTDVRLIQNSLYHRVIVAGAGGGSSKYNNGCIGGIGGGLVGGTGDRCYQSEHAGSGGTQISGGITSNNGVNGNFGYGGNKTNNDGCGGGGGFYGGGAGHAHLNTGGGGSGFIFTKDNKEISDINNITLPYSLFLEDAITIAGSESFFSPDGNTNETGHSGNGIIVITFISDKYIHTCLVFNILPAGLFYYFIITYLSLF